MGKLSKWPMLAFTALLAVSGAISSPLTSPATSILDNDSLSNGLPNTTLTAAVIPRDFTIEPSAPLNETALSERNVLILTIRTLGFLALGDFLEQQSAQTWRTLQHVAVDVTGAHREIDSPIAMRKYAVWGIYKAAHAMVGSEDFRPRDYELFWQGTLVGYVSFNDGAAHKDSASAAELEQSGHSVSPPIIFLPNVTTIDLADTHPSFSYVPYGRTIGESNVFMTLCTGIVKAAPYPISDRVDEFLVNTRSFSTFLSLKGTEGRKLTRFFSFEDVIEMFVGLPKWVLESGARWTETDMVVSVDEMAIGAGVMKWQGRRQVGVKDGADVVSA